MISMHNQCEHSGQFISDCLPICIVWTIKFGDFLLLIGIVRTIDLGYRLLIEIARTIDLEGGLLIGIVRTIYLEIIY